MTVQVHDDGKDIDVCVEVDPNGFLYLKAYDGETRVHDFPKMTPFEASMLARELSRAAEKADAQ
jgi:hypothetical protein